MATLHENSLGLLMNLKGCRRRHTIETTSQMIGNVGEMLTCSSVFLDKWRCGKGILCLWDPSVSDWMEGGLTVEHLFHQMTP